MNLALLGHGKMGRLVEELARQKGMTIQLILDESDNRDSRGITGQNFKGVDVCVDFTTPEAVLGNIERLAGLGQKMVVGTTGWYKELDRVRAMVRDGKAGLVYGPNFSIGMNIFYKVVSEAAERFRTSPLYDPWIEEAHHKMKKDAPSGTALRLKEILAEAYKTGEIPTTSVRAGYIPGRHTVGFDSEADTVILTHTARSRMAFAEGALLAASWIRDKVGMYEFSEILFGKS
jgi:4-hydroxy-tetrahydrodipicolinate reductase